MILYGEGGTGKSRVIQTVTEAFVTKGVDYMLVKSAYTGVAASLIDGKTTHTIAHLSIGSDGTISDDSKVVLQEFWRNRQYLIIDEFSMLAKTFLANLSNTVSVGKEGTPHRKDRFWGGINVVLCGDLHQFPPVAKGASEALFRPIGVRDSDDCALGRMTYEEFTTVVILKEQMRVTDEVWRKFLAHLRHGNVQPRHIDMLRSLIINQRESPHTDFDSAPWSDASLVTPRHAVRKMWNAAAVRKWCRKSGERLFVVGAEDSCKGRPLTVREKYAVLMRNKDKRNRSHKKDLPEQIELAKGMKVMVTSNVETDLDVANGARGEIVDIVLHPDEPPLGPEPVVNLMKYLPAFVLVKLSRTRATTLEGLGECVIPVEPMAMSMRIKVDLPGGMVGHRYVRRKQFPVTGAYAFTDYQSQGQTIPIVIVDMKTPPPPGTLSLFNLYVALSRSSGRSTIRLLRDFDPELLLKQSHDPDLLAEDDRLERLNEQTKAWWVEMGHCISRDPSSR
ncbi:ATP-dependent DNA helicase PIF1 [Sparassis crispa]|uniref:ATP-dependent DNA helicase n=1 Tax=Sparassis crispa TaxID=139825 RepID=A0A401GD13_9APHY|nr:ATP-dependent DNA helicase PIF1 [Sparassis crispa]GBE80035.1 ATP-dependent DNA helicase PIF1 [Sparassis crispa]